MGPNIAANTIAAGADPAGSEQPASSARVIVVEGDLRTRDQICRTLSAFDFQVTRVAAGADAVAAIREARRAGAPFEALVVELELPDMDGLELVRRAAGEDPSLLPILISAKPSPREPATAAVRAGAIDFLVDPIDAFRLGRSVGEAIAARRALSRP